MWPSWCEHFRLQRKKENKITTIMWLNFPGQMVLKQRGWKKPQLWWRQWKDVGLLWERAARFMRAPPALTVQLCATGWRVEEAVLCLRTKVSIANFYAPKRADSGSSLSQECSAIWEVSMWGQRTACVTLHQQTHSKLEHSHAWSQKHHSIWRIPSSYHHP